MLRSATNPTAGTPTGWRKIDTPHSRFVASKTQHKVQSPTPSHAIRCVRCTVPYQTRTNKRSAKEVRYFDRPTFHCLGLKPRSRPRLGSGVRILPEAELVYSTCVQHGATEASRPFSIENRMVCSTKSRVSRTTRGALSTLPEQKC